MLIDTDPAAVPALTRRAVNRITAALAYLDDSNGSISADLHTMMAVHARACTAAPPNPSSLARWLANRRFDGPGWPDFELRDFATALDRTGRGELTRILEQHASDADTDSFSMRYWTRILRSSCRRILKSGSGPYFVIQMALVGFMWRGGLACVGGRSSLGRTSALLIILMRLTLPSTEPEL
ncbi:hypothetical protein [Pseudonocardia sp. GCM10023141]|uniref:hypothetical protein n=1 Tax=Pseudonocardia sp. GCM10023141 TaxID=3252653 RepID=UPI00360F0D54